MDYRKSPAPLAPIMLHGSPVNTVKSFRFLGTVISHDLKWESNISSLTKKAHQRSYFLRQLRKCNLPFMQCWFTSTQLTSSISVWYPAATARDKGRLQCTILTAERVSLPSLLSLACTPRGPGRLCLNPPIPDTVFFQHSPQGSAAGGCFPAGPGVLSAKLAYTQKSCVRHFSRKRSDIQRLDVRKCGSSRKFHVWRTHISGEFCQLVAH